MIDLAKQDISELVITTKYCVENDVHDRNVRYSLGLNLPPIECAKANRPDRMPLALVCSGPSLKSTIRDARPFRKIISCSGAHDALLDEGIVPTWHVETDPRPHKAKFLTRPQKGVIYLIASNCAPEVFDALRGFNVRLWHVLSRKDLSYYPRGHWLVTGGSCAGLRAMTIARLLGFVNIHIFGMDCSADSQTCFHSGDHPNEPKEKAKKKVLVAGREFITSDVFLEYARQFFKETALIPDAEITLHGDGLLQALAMHRMNNPEEIKKRSETVKANGKVTLALTLPEIISPRYRALNQQLHEANPEFGASGHRRVDIVKKLVESIKAKTVLDYGAGKQGLAKEMDFPIWNYDPCVPGIDMPPRPADLVVCSDVLEHVEPEYLNATLFDLRRVIRKLGYFVVHTGPSTKQLGDGRNTHLIQQEEPWWRSKLERFFNVPANGIKRQKLKDGYYSLHICV